MVVGHQPVRCLDVLEVGVLQFEALDVRRREARAQCVVRCQRVLCAPTRSLQHRQQLGHALRRHDVDRQSGQMRRFGEREAVRSRVLRLPAIWREAVPGRGGKKAYEYCG
jgi:hypothetical protein